MRAVWLWCWLAVVSGCSGSARLPERHGISAAAGGGAGSGTLAAPGFGGSFSSNPTGTVVPTSPLPDAGMSDPAMRIPSTREPVSIDQCGANNPAGVTGANLSALLAGGTGPGNLRWLYPYEGTVFPRGMLAPMLMWDGGAADAVFVHIKSQFFEYKGCLKPSADGQLVLPQDVWDRAGVQSFGKQDPYTIRLSVLRAGAVTGPITRVITIAQANIKGSIYYTSYSSMLGRGLPGPGGGAPAPGGLPFPGGGLPPLGGLGAGGSVLRIPQGKIAEPFLNTGCNGCHAVSANGARLISQFTPGFGQSYQLDMNTAANPPAMMAGPRAAWGALYPDGTRYLATSAVIDVARTYMTQGLGAPIEATLYDTATGQVVPNTGIPAGALMPMFSPDGTLLVFNDNALANAHGLALMKYDVASNKASEARTLTMTQGSMRPGWPFILPDNRAVVFVQTDGPDFSGNGAGLALAAGLGLGAPVSDLFVVDVESGSVTLLARAMGFDTPAAAASNQTYLPFGANELHHNYFPTVSPVAAGGYFWVFFDSVRNYGNFGQQRALWASAIEIQPDGKYLADHSHPAFYLPGQEFNTGNHRAFAALDPCKPEGGDCLSGIDCCGGFCFLPEPTEFGQPPGKCSPPKNECAKTDERCLSDADCCPPEAGQPPNSCIAGFCAYVMLQ